jgi:hypothetical protein
MSIQHDYQLRDTLNKVRKGLDYMDLREVLSMIKYLAIFELKVEEFMLTIFCFGRFVAILSRVSS